VGCQGLFAPKVVQKELFANFVLEIADKYANLQSSFGTDWFQAAM
jgi:hypothetical protein